MAKKSIKKPSFSNFNSNFHSLTEATKDITKERSDNVASLGIVGLVICFITLTVVGGIVFYIHTSNNPSPNQRSLVNLSSM